jgi:hypothetical protein
MAAFKFAHSMAMMGSLLGLHFTMRNLERRLVLPHFSHGMGGIGSLSSNTPRHTSWASHQTSKCVPVLVTPTAMFGAQFSRTHWAQ